MELRDTDIRGTTVIAGDATGPLCRLAQPISLWGGVDPMSGRIIDPRHADFGRTVSQTILALPGSIGSSSSSAVMLELLRRRTAPAGLLIADDDTILPLGIIVATELGYPAIPVVKIPMTELAGWPQGETIRMSEGGIIAPVT